MAEEYPRCPVCYSPITTDPEEIESLKEEGIHVWTEDPLLTLRGLAGEEYKGKTPCRWLHIKELQEARKQQEEDAGIPEEERTTFSEVKKGEPIRRVHIEELRGSTEKILEAMGYTKEDYFNYDEDGNEMRVEHQLEWTDPNLLLGTPRRAIHIEDLRHPLISRIASILGIFSVISPIDTEELYTYLFDSKINELVDKKLFSWDSRIGFYSFLKASDDKYLWTYRAETNFGNSIVGYSWYTGERKHIDISDFGLTYLRGMFSDGVYLWLVTEEESDFYVGRLHIESMQFEQIGTFKQPDVEPKYEQFQIISVDQVYFYTMQTYKGITGTDANSHQRMEKVVRPIVQESVLDKDLNDPPPNPAEGDRYLIISGGIDTDWFGHDNEITEYSGDSWHFYRPVNNWVVRVEDEDEYYIFTNSNWSIWDRKFEVESFVNIPISYNLTTTDIFPQSGRYTHDGFEKRYWYVPQYYWSGIFVRIIDGVVYYEEGHYYCKKWGINNCLDARWNIEEPYPPFIVDYETWQLLGSDDEYIYIKKKIIRNYWGYCNKREIGYGGILGIRTFWSFDWYKTETLLHDIIRIAKEDFSSENFMEVSNIIGEGRDFVCSGPDYSSTLHLDQQIKDFVIDRRNIYTLCYDWASVDKREDSTIACPFPICAEAHSIRVVNIPYPHLTCPEWYKYIEGVGYRKRWDTESGYPEIAASTIMPKGFSKIYDKQGNLLKIYDQQIGQFDFDKYEEIYDTQRLGLLIFDAHMCSSKQKWFVINQPKYLRGG